MSTYGLKYFAEIQNFRGQCARVEIYQRDLPSGTVTLRIGDVCGLVLEMQGGQEDIFAPIVKTQARLSMISSDDKPTSAGTKYGGWGEFFTPDATLYKMVIKTQATAVGQSWKTRWSGFITPDSWQEGLEYRGAVTITARDNIGHLQDFDFDMPGDTYGLATIRSVITSAMAKIELPMALSFSSAPGELEGNQKRLIDSSIVVTNFRGKDWYSVLEGLLDSIGYCLRFTDNNRVTVAPLRNIPLLGEADVQDQPQMSDLEFYGGTGEQVPAVKQITDEHDYDYTGEVFLPVIGSFSFGPTQTYREFMEGNILPAGGKINKVEHDACFNKLTNAADTVWELGSDLLNTALYGHESRLEEGWDRYAFLPINGVDDDIRTQTLSFLTGDTDVTIKVVFARRPVTLGPGVHSGDPYRIIDEGNSLYKIRYYIRYEKGNSVRYWDGRSWGADPSPIEKEFDSQYDYATDLEIALAPCTELAAGGRIYLTFDGIWYKHWPGISGYTYGDYARLASVSVIPNANNLSRNTVKTINDEKYNVSLNRSPMMAPLSVDTPFAVPENYGTALFYYPSGEVHPAAFPYMVNWDTVSGNVTKPLPVFIHQQILCYRGANLWELSGECSPSGNNLFWFNSQAHYKGRTYILMSGTLDFFTGNVSGAVLREFLEYDDLWDDSVPVDPGAPGSWESTTSYPGGGSPSTSSSAGSSLAPGGGKNFFEEDGEGGVRLKSEYSWLAVGEARMSWEDEDEYFHINHAVVTEGDQIVIDGDPGGGGGGGGAMYLHELLDVTITLPSNGQTLFYQDGMWVNGNIDFSNYYTKAQVDDIIGTIQQFHYEVYASREDVIDPQNNVLYLIGPTGSGSDKYEEYIYSGDWVKIGDTSIDLSGYVQTSRLEADEAILSEAIQSFQSQIDAVSARNNFDELTATSFYADMLATTYAYAERYYLTDDVYFSIEKVNGTACVRLNAPFITDGDQIIISGTPGSGGGGSGVTLYDYTQVKAMTADVALTAPSAWAMHQMWAEIFGGASSVLTSGNYTNYVNTTNFPGLDKIGTVTSVATGTGLTGGTITSAGVISIDPTYLGYISHGETAYGWGDILTQAIQSFQSQIDSISARDAFDELTATALYSDTGAISALYAGSIELGGEDLATAVSGIRGRLASVESKFDADGSALSSVRLKNTRTLWGQNFDGTANVVGDMTSVGSLTASGLIKTTNYAQAQRFYLTDSIYFYTETIDGVACVMLNAPFVTSGDQIIISGTPGGGGQGVGYLYELEDVSDALASPTSGMVLFYNGTEWVGVAASSIGGVTSVVGQTGAVTTEQVANALTAAGYKLTDTITTSLAWSSITNTPTTLAGYGITDAASASAISALTTRVGTLESDEAVVSAAIQSLQSQIDSVSARDRYDELAATALFADTLSASNAYIESITGSLSGNAATASRLVGASYNVGNVNKPVYFSGGLPVETTYAIYASLFNGTAGRLAYYNTAHLVSDYTGNVGSATQPMHLVAGVPTACTYTLSAALLAATTAGKLAYYSGTNSVSSYTSTIGSGVIPMYLNAGVPTASTATVGSAAIPVYLNGGTITACSGASVFSHIGSNAVNNLELTIAGQLRTATLYATYDNAGENISDKFGIVGQAIQSLQSQVDSVSARNSFDEVMATVGFIDTLSVGDAVYSTKGCIAQYLTVGQTSIATYPLYVVGVIASTGDQVVTSDATKKMNLKDIALSVGQIASAPAVTFDWKTGGRSFGSIAQYWKGVLPESVLGEEGDYSLAYAQLALVSAINLARHETEQDREIRELKKKVARLENEVERLRN